MQMAFPIPKLHLEHCHWINELNFYGEELTILERHLKKRLILHSEMNDKGVQIFEQRFNKLRGLIDSLKTTLNVEEKQLISFIKEVSGLGLDSIKMDNHLTSRERMCSFREQYNKLKQDIRLFDFS
jgi:flavin-dependent dehydrogenase